MIKYCIDLEELKAAKEIEKALHSFGMEHEYSFERVSTYEESNITFSDVLRRCHKTCNTILVDINVNEYRNIHTPICSTYVNNILRDLISS